MRGRWVLIVLVLIAGCGKRQPWPATVTSMSGFSSDQRQQVESAVLDMNSRAGYTIVNSSNTGTAVTFPITITYGTPTDEADSANLAGQARVADDNCSVSLSAKLFLPEHAADLEPVIWHELGHCAGLSHVTDPGAIMYPTTNSLSSYQPTALSQFFKSVISSSGLSFSHPSGN